MNLYSIWVSLSEMSDTNIEIFHDIQLFFRCTCIYTQVIFGRTLSINLKDISVNPKT